MQAADHVYSQHLQADIKFNTDQLSRNTEVMGVAA